MTCKCGFTKEENLKCDGTHKLVKKIREQIAQEIEAIELVTSVSNALGIKVEAAKIARGIK